MSHKIKSATVLKRERKDERDKLVGADFDLIVVVQAKTGETHTLTKTLPLTCSDGALDWIETPKAEFRRVKVNVACIFCMPLSGSGGRTYFRSSEFSIDSKTGQWKDKPTKRTNWYAVWALKTF